MICIYDFDGTLTPYALPQYPILKQCQCMDLDIMNRVKAIREKQKLGLYEAYYQCYREILEENEIEMSKKNICLGAQDVELNEGVIEYFKRLKRISPETKHYIVTSGIKDYIEETTVSKLVDGVFGVTFHQENGVLRDIDFLLTDKKKIDVIQMIQSQNDGTNRIIYFGDGLTDRYAFQYVHKIGGKNVFVVANEHAKSTYQKLKKKGIIDFCFDADFREGFAISHFMEQQVSLHRNDTER